MTDVVRRLADQAPTETRQQYLDNLRWIEQAEENALVVGSQARIYMPTMSVVAPLPWLLMKPLPMGASRHPLS